MPIIVLIILKAKNSYTSVKITSSNCLLNYDIVAILASFQFVFVDKIKCKSSLTRVFVYRFTLGFILNLYKKRFYVPINSHVCQQLSFFFVNYTFGLKRIYIKSRPAFSSHITTPVTT